MPWFLWAPEGKVQFPRFLLFFHKELIVEPVAAGSYNPSANDERIASLTRRKEINNPAAENVIVGIGGLGQMSIDVVRTYEAAMGKELQAGAGLRTYSIFCELPTLNGAGGAK